jgi:hypothetical protein
MNELTYAPTPTLGDLDALPAQLAIAVAAGSADDIDVVTDLGAAVE